MNWRAKILTPLSGQYWYGPMIFEAIDEKKSLDFCHIGEMNIQ